MERIVVLGSQFGGVSWWGRSGGRSVIQLGDTRSQEADSGEHCCSLLSNSTEIPGTFRVALRISIKPSLQLPYRHSRGCLCQF